MLDDIFIFKKEKYVKICSNIYYYSDKKESIEILFFKIILVYILYIIEIYYFI